MFGSEVAVRDKELLFGSSCATNCATHDQQRLTICRRFGAHNRRRPFSILFTNSKTRLSASWEWTRQGPFPLLAFEHHRYGRSSSGRKKRGPTRIVAKSRRS